MNNGLSQEQLVVTWNSKRSLYITEFKCMCMCMGVRDRKTERDEPVHHLEHRDNPRWSRKSGAISLSLLVPWSKPCFLTRGPSTLPAMARTGLRVWNEPLQGVQHPVLKWIDPKRAAGQVRFIYRATSTNRLKPFLENNACVCVILCRQPTLRQPRKEEEAEDALNVTTDVCCCFFLKHNLQI